MRVDRVRTAILADIWVMAEFTFMNRTMQQRNIYGHSSTCLAVNHTPINDSGNMISQGMSPTPEAAAHTSQTKLRNATAQETISSRNMSTNQTTLTVVSLMMRLP
jgi:hypothetical protein